MSDTETSQEPTANESTEEEETKEEDPEVTSLKEQISKLEGEIKAKKSSIASIQEMADRYTKSGYARQVALVENNKRMRGANMADDKFAARANVVSTFLPVLDDLDGVSAKYEGDEFAKSLGALRSEFMNSLATLGVCEYDAQVGDVVDGGRVVATSEEYSEECAKGTVVSAVRNGFEISGNVVRPAECVGSLGSEKTDEEAESKEDVAEAGEEAAASE